MPPFARSSFGRAARARRTMTGRVSAAWAMRSIVAQLPIRALARQLDLDEVAAAADLGVAQAMATTTCRSSRAAR